VEILKILIAGIDSFLGKNLLPELRKSGEHQIIGTSRQGGSRPYDMMSGAYYEKVYCLLDNQEWASQLYNNFQPDVIFCLAASADNSKPDSDVFLSNIKIVDNLSRCAPKGCKFVFSSSATVYGDSNSIFATDESDLVNPTSLYGASKAACENLLMARHKLGDINAKILRFCGIVGPGMSHGAIPAIAKKILDRDKPVELIGENPGSQKSYVHIDDAVAALMKATFDLDEEYWSTFNVAARETVSILEIYNEINRQLFIPEDEAKSRLSWSGSYWRGDNVYSHISSKRLIREGFAFKYGTSSEAVEAAINSMVKENKT
jgi:UDP-glucose 4-epimerase